MGAFLTGMQWCSLCTDFAQTAILCAECRVAICCTSPDSSGGCLEWDPIIERDDFVFHCPFCARAAKKRCLVSAKLFSHKWSLRSALPFQLALRENSLPERDSIWFRYDPPVIVVAVTWHATTARFGRFAYDRLAFGYQSNAAAVRVYLIPICQQPLT